MTDLSAGVIVFIYDGKGRTSNGIANAPGCAKCMYKRRFAGAHGTVEGKYLLLGKLMPERFGGLVDVLQIETDLHPVKILFLRMETVNWKVEGMSCSTCALTIGKYLEKKGLQNVKVSLASGDVSFETSTDTDRQQIRKGIQDLGYTVLQEGAGADGLAPAGKSMNRHLRNLLISLPFTVLLMLHMAAGFLQLHWLMDPWIQCLICLPVYVLGMRFFGTSAIRSLMNGLPNMDVLIATGTTAAFLYSLTGTTLHLGPSYLFYDTAAEIITLVFFGYYLEDISVRSTQRSLDRLARSQRTMATMIAFDDQHQEVLFPVENKELRAGDLVLIRTGDQVPADCKILWGEAGVNEAIITGESLPVNKKGKDALIGGSLMISGTVRAQVTADPRDSVLANIVRMVQQAQGEKPPVQQLADRISAFFVPAVMAIALLSFLANYSYLHSFAPSLMRSIAVLVIACPCAMGLATPAAIAVGLGRAARKGVLIRNARTLESFKDIGQVIFDKTGTLTKGEFVIGEWQVVDSACGAEEFKRIAYSLEKYSAHPIARCITAGWKQKNEIKWVKIEEMKGLGMRAETREGDVFWAGSLMVANEGASGPVDRAAPGMEGLDAHQVYIMQNDRLLGWIDLRDEVRPEAKPVVKWLHDRGIRTVLLSGDRAGNCMPLAKELGIEEVLAERRPAQKLEEVTRLNSVLPTVMVGDGINDAPALAQATIGISMSDASQLAIQTADVVLVNHGLLHLPACLGLGTHTYLTIRQNLFWAFFYNVLAIPLAAFGLLTPAVAALAMGLSDVILALNSVRLFVKKVE
jgi:Cu+-exporting ATPase